MIVTGSLLPCSVHSPPTGGSSCPAYCYFSSNILLRDLDLFLTAPQAGGINRRGIRAEESHQSPIIIRPCQYDWKDSPGLHLASSKLQCPRVRSTLKVINTFLKVAVLLFTNLFGILRDLAGVSQLCNQLVRYLGAWWLFFFKICIVLITAVAWHTDRQDWVEKGR